MVGSDGVGKMYEFARGGRWPWLVIRSLENRLKVKNACRYAKFLTSDIAVCVRVVEYLFMYDGRLCMMEKILLGLVFVGKNLHMALVEAIVGLLFACANLIG